ncbi:Crp/Fnr family transcriptional regulator [Candidatus Woesebacteria bacterium]|nr:Crp/Fnr family transcriptional regulator [Candidatus Woesebacteria bacterium]
MTKPTIPEQVLSFYAQYPAQTFPPKHILLAANSEPAGVYFVESGHIKQYALTVQGQELVVNIYKPGTFFPMMWAVANIANSYFFETVDTVVVRRAPVEECLKFLSSHPDVTVDLLKRLYTGIDGLVSQMTHNSYSDAKRKVLAVLIMAAKRFGKQEGNQIRIIQQFTHKEIGALSATSRETVTRVLQEIEADKLICIEKRRMIITDIRRLEEALTSI